MRIAILSIALAMVAALVSAAEPAPTLQQCATLLPKGKSYSFSLSGTIDTTGAEPHFAGELQVSDGKAFAQCVRKLVR